MNTATDSDPELPRNRPRFAPHKRPNAHAASPPQRVFVALSAIAKRWRVHRSTARRILDRGGVRPFALGGARGGTVRYDLQEVLAFEKLSREDVR